MEARQCHSTSPGSPGGGVARQKGAWEGGHTRAPLVRLRRRLAVTALVGACTPAHHETHISCALQLLVLFRTDQTCRMGGRSFLPVFAFTACFVSAVLRPPHRRVPRHWSARHCLVDGGGAGSTSWSSRVSVLRPSFSSTHTTSFASKHATSFASASSSSSCRRSVALSGVGDGGGRRAWRRGWVGGGGRGAG